MNIAHCSAQKGHMYCCIDLGVSKVTKLKFSAAGDIHKNAEQALAVGVTPLKMNTTANTIPSHKKWTAQ